MVIYTDLKRFFTIPPYVGCNITKNILFVANRNYYMDIYDCSCVTMRCQNISCDYIF
jgi:hypothetical protein